VWTTRLARPEPNLRTVVADLCGSIVGFVHTNLDDDPAWDFLTISTLPTASSEGGSVPSSWRPVPARWSTTHHRGGSTCGCWSRMRTPKPSMTGEVADASNASVENRCRVTGCVMCGTALSNS
jgi:hypothetical protein